MNFIDDDRGVSSPLGYVMNLSVLLIVIVSVSFAASAFMTSTTQISTENGLEATGQQFARGVMEVDRLARASDSTGEVGKMVALPPEINGKYYKIQVVNESDASTVTACSNSCIILRTNDGEVNSVVDFYSATEVNSKTFQGGAVYVVREAGDSSLSFVVEDV